MPGTIIFLLIHRSNPCILLKYPFVCSALHQIITTLRFLLFKFYKATTSCIFVELKMKKNTSIGSFFAATLVAKGMGFFPFLHQEWF